MGENVIQFDDRMHKAKREAAECIETALQCTGHPAKEVRRTPWMETELGGLVLQITIAGPPAQAEQAQDCWDRKMESRLGARERMRAVVAFYGTSA